jgi:transposase
MAFLTYALTDNEKTVTVDHVCGIAVRNATIVEVSRHYGLTIATCAPADAQSKGGVEATVRIAKVIWSRPITTSVRSIRTGRRLSGRVRRSWLM